MKIKFDRIVSIATLVASLVAIVLVLKRPAPVAHPQAPAAIAEHAQAFDQKMAEFEQAAQRIASEQSLRRFQSPTPGHLHRSSPKAEVHINSDEISAVLAQTLGNAAGESSLSPDSNVGSAAPTIKDQQVTFEGDCGTRAVPDGNCRQRCLDYDLRAYRRKGWLCHVRSYGI